MEISAEVGRMTPSTRVFLTPVGIEVGGIARDGEIGEETLLVELPKGTIMDEALVEKVSFERVEGRSEGGGKLPGAVEIGFANGGRAGDVLIGSRAKLRESCFDVSPIINEVWLGCEELFQLLRSESTVDGEFPEAFALLALEIFDDEIGQSGKVRESGAGKKGAEMIGAEIGF